MLFRSFLAHLRQREAGLAQSDRAWSAMKKAWCCKHKQLGCSSTSTSTKLPTTEPFQCYQGLEMAHSGWSPEKQVWCCVNKKLGCTTTTLTTQAVGPHYQCAASSTSWEKWPAKQREWCCAKRGIGCTTTAGPRARDGNGGLAVLQPQLQRLSEHLQPDLDAIGEIGRAHV